MEGKEEGGGEDGIGETDRYMPDQGLFGPSLIIL